MHNLYSILIFMKDVLKYQNAHHMLLDIKNCMQWLHAQLLNQILPYLFFCLIWQRFYTHKLDTYWTVHTCMVSTQRQTDRHTQSVPNTIIILNNCSLVSCHITVTSSFITFNRTGNNLSRIWLFLNDILLQLTMIYSGLSLCALI